MLTEPVIAGYAVVRLTENGWHVRDVHPPKSGDYAQYLVDTENRYTPGKYARATIVVD